MARTLALIAGLGLAIVGVLILLCVRITTLADHNAFEMTKANALASIDQYQALRNYYADHVATKLTRSEAVEVTDRHKGVEGAVPLPATMLLDLGDIAAQNDSGPKVKLFSEYPFANRKARQLDDFERRAIAWIEKNPGEVYVESDFTRGAERVRVAAGDYMSNQGCVDCHNTFPGTPRTDWALGDLRGALEIDSPIHHQMEGIHVLRGQAWTYTGFAALLVAGVIGVIVLIFRGQSKRAELVAKAMQRAAGGDLTCRRDFAGTDAVAQLGQGLQRFVCDLGERVRSIAERAGVVGQASGTLDGLSGQMREQVQQSGAAAGDAAQGTEQIRGSVQEVNRAVEELRESIDEIGRSTQSAAGIAQEAVSAARTADGRMRELSESSEGIGEVIKLITSIAEQTNLLALNATIEAARAGQAGKGFAVVANEVKELAKETSQATGQIGQKLESMRQATQDTSGALSEIGGIVDRINDSQSVIASAVEEQTAVTATIAGDLERLVELGERIAGQVRDAVDANQRTGADADRTRQEAEALARLSGELQEVVGFFQVGPEA